MSSPFEISMAYSISWGKMADGQHGITGFESIVFLLACFMVGGQCSRLSTVLIRYCDDLFDSESSTATVGVDFKASYPYYCSRWYQSTACFVAERLNGTAT